MKLRNLFEQCQKIIIESEFSKPEAYRGVSLENAKIILKQGYLLPSQDLMPLDYEVIAHSIGDEINDMSEEEIEQWLHNTVSWYNGSYESIVSGVNLTTDKYNASGYGNGVVFGVVCNGEVALFTDEYLFAKSAKECVPVMAIYKGEELSIPQLKAVLRV